jgi:uncharacterized membrane protein
MSMGDERPRDEKEEKGDAGEKWRRDPIEALGWALLLIWIGIVILAEYYGYLVRFERLETWSIIMIGAGVLVLLGVLARLVVPAYRKPVLGNVILGVILLAIGLTDVVDIKGPVVAAIILFLIGGAIIVGGLTRGRGP